MIMTQSTKSTMEWLEKKISDVEWSCQVLEGKWNKTGKTTCTKLVDSYRKRVQIKAKRTLTVLL